MNSNITTAEALSCTIMLLQCTAGPVGLDLKHLMQWVTCISAVYRWFGQVSSSISVLTWWLYGHQVWEENTSYCCTAVVRAEIIMCRPVVSKQHHNVTISCHARPLSSSVTLVNVWETRKHMIMERMTACDSQPRCYCSTKEADVESNIYSFLDYLFYSM